jgi:iron(III) transport system permease protein
MVAGSLVTVTGGWGLDAYRGVLRDARQWQLLATSLSMAGGAAIVAGCLGIPLGFALARAGRDGGHRWRLLLGAPLFLPPYVIALAWALTVGPAGPLAALVSPERLSQWTYSTAGASLALAASLFPVVAFGVEAALTGVNARAEEAGRMVATPVRVLTRITLPLVAPAVAATGLLVFALALTEFGVPGLLRVRVYTTEVFTAFSSFYDFARATALATPLLVLVLLLMTVAIRATEPMRAATRRHSTSRPVASLRARRIASAALAGASVVTVVVPLAVLIAEARSLRDPASILGGSGPAIATSLVTAAASATLVAGVSAVLGYARGHLHNQPRARPLISGSTVALGWLASIFLARSARRDRSSGRNEYNITATRRTAVPRGWLLDLACVWLFAVPGTIVGVGLIRLWNRPGLDAVYGTAAMLVLANVARFLPLGVLLTGVAARQVPASLEEAAAMTGASWPRTWLRVWLPQLRGAILAVWSLTFVLAFGELGASVLVNPPGSTTLPVHIYTLVANAPPGQLAALALLQAVVGMVGLWAVSRNWRRLAW